MKPHPARLRAAGTGFLIVGGRASPRDDFSRLPEDTEVVSGVRINFTELRVDVKHEIRAPPPIDEEDGVAAGVHA